jgi:hypothetical protein
MTPLYLPAKRKLELQSVIRCQAMLDVSSPGTWLTCAALSAALLVGAPHAVAQGDTERAGARAAATEGATAFQAGDYAKAVDLFTRAESLVHAPPHLLYIARSHEKLGQLVKAREAYLKITRDKLAADAPDAFRQAKTSAEQELAALEPRIPYLTINVKGQGAESAAVLMDDKEVPKALVGVPYPVDPGEHSLEARGAGVKSKPVKVTVAEGRKESIELAVESAPGSTPPDTGSDAGGAADLGTASSGPSGMRIGAYVALGVGVVGAGVGTFFLLRASSKRSEADDLCTLPGGGCPPENQDEINSLDDDADSATTIGVAGLVVGGLGIATGVTLFILSSKHESTASKPGIQPWVGLGSAGVSGRF